jgi:integrase
LSRLGPNQLTVRKLESLKDGTYSDGGNLWITVEGKTRRWSIRFKSPVTGRRREMGIGSYRDITLAEARALTAETRKLLLAGLDPIEQRLRDKAIIVPKAVLTFEAVTERYLADRKSGWSDPRAVPVWRSSLRRFAYPSIGEMAIEAVATENVIAILRPIWATKTETADRVRGRLERIFDYARTHGWRHGDNPAQWKGHLSNILPPRSSVAQVEHHAAVKWQDVAAVMVALGKSEGMASRAVRFACLTAARSGEVRGAKWSEIDLRAKMWTIPAERMKANKEHRVPLSVPAIELLQQQWPVKGKPPADGLVFPGQKRNRPLSDVGLLKAVHTALGAKDATVHGFRSTFRDWVAESTEYPGEVAEMALAHVIGSKVEAAYRRGDLLEKRREMMEAWGRWCAGVIAADQVS